MKRDGVLIIDKPSGLTSRQVVSRVKRVSEAAKAGHTGTLDPLATGVLIVCIGRATLLSQVLSRGLKRYEVKAILGVATDTYDIDGEVVSEGDSKEIEPEQVEAVFGRFTGVVMQMPPEYSAVKHHGKPLYHYARKGINVKVEPREVDIREIKLGSFERDGEKTIIGLEVNCGPGTYIRSLVSDIGSELGCGGCVSELRRVQTGRFTIDEACRLENVLSGKDDLDDVIVPIEDATADLPTIVVSDTGGHDVMCGKPLEERWVDSVSGDVGPGSVIRIISGTGTLLALHKGMDRGDGVEYVSKALRVIRVEEQVNNNEVA
ncbi:MAG: tRNA pseudouridine(55) synthase TruB [Actinobacteria bacterium]|nr:tRNA pseudouridine(55) synthase TruB [Actinomycetota bacterium]